MPKLLFKPKFHIIGENSDIFVTPCLNGQGAICIKCNELAAFILEQMYPEHKPRTEIAALVKQKFGCSEEDALLAVNTVISALLPKEEETDDE